MTKQGYTNFNASKKQISIHKTVKAYFYAQINKNECMKDLLSLYVGILILSNNLNIRAEMFFQKATAVC